MSHPSITFGMMVSAESADLIECCLRHLRRSYPDAPVIVFFDGRLPDPPTAAVCRAYNVLSVLGARLKKGVRNGAGIWTRFFQFTLPFGTDFIVKLDPDTRVHKPLTLFPADDMACAGTLMSRGYEAQHVQGGFQLFTKALASSLYFESQGSIYCSHDGWKCGQSNVFADRDLVSTDYLLRAMMLSGSVQGVMIEHGEMDCRSVLREGSPPFRADACVTHPHKQAE